MTERTAIDAVAEAWASIDGKLEKYNFEKVLVDPDPLGIWGYYEGYQAEAEEMIRRIEARGFRIVRASA